MTPKLYISRLAICLLLPIAIFTSKTSSAQQFLTTIDGWNAYVHLPDEYNDSVTKKYPLIIYIPGLGEVGTDPNRLLTYGPAKFIAAGASMNFMVNGKLEKPIVISIQPATAWPNAYVINKKVDTILSKYRVDLKRISGTGLSMGGWSWNNYVDNYNPIYTNRMASIVVMSALEPDNGIGNMKHYALGGGKWWGFEGNTDLRKGDMIRDTMNAAVPGSARYTLYIGGHCCWNNFYNPAYNENGESLYTWMLKQVRPCATFAIPQANAGRDTSVPVVQSSLTLKGSGNDPVGNPISFTWTKLGGPSGGTIASPATAQTTVSSMTTGTYTYELKVVNSLGGVGKDTVTVSNGNIVMPVKLVDFRAIEQADHVQLQWKTNIEVNSSHFIVERSMEGTNFTEIGNVTAAGNTSGEKFYTFNDVTAVAGINYYRLKMVDLDDSAAYSKIINVDLSNIKSVPTKIVVARYINSKLNMVIYSREEKTAQLMLTDPIGRIVYKGSMAIAIGENNIEKFIPSAKGVYYISLLDNEGRMTKTVFNQ